MTNTIKVTYANGTVIEGTVTDRNEAGNILYVTNEVDTYMVNTQVVTIEEVMPLAETVRHMEMKDAVKDIQKLFKWADETSLKVLVYECEEGEISYDVEIRAEYDEETEYIVTDTFGTEKDAMKRAKAVVTSLAKKFELSTKEVVLYHV